MKYTKDNPKLVENIYNFKGIKTFTGVVEDKNTIAYHVNGKYHRENGPAVEFSDGYKEWIINGKRHREDGPAVITDSYQWWYQNGVLHRLDGPALIMYKGDKATRNIYYINDKKLNKTKLPYFMNGELAGPMRLNRNSILRASLFDREYGAFLKEKYDAMLKSK
jgi:hypothetical protein